MKTIKVVATGNPVPREDSPLRYITKTEPLDVPAGSPYYGRRIDEGELKVVTDDKKGA
jgi:hypothetical protein